MTVTEAIAANSVRKIEANNIATKRAMVGFKLAGEAPIYAFTALRLTRADGEPDYLTQASGTLGKRYLRGKLAVGAR